jgi:hypothetical protein
MFPDCVPAKVAMWEFASKGIIATFRRLHPGTIATFGGLRSENIVTFRRKQFETIAICLSDNQFKLCRNMSC